MNQNNELNKYITEFKKGIKKGPFKNWKETSIVPETFELFEAAVKQGYLDASRTFNGIDKNRESLNKGLDALATMIQNYFKKTQEFDHEKFCNCLNSIPDITYGQKQKIVNMAFKYLYCCKNATIDYQEFFEPCHMALDSYTLRWYRRINKKQKAVEWSKLTSDVYCIIQSEISKLAEEANQTAFELEFKVWQDELLLEALTGLNKTLSKTIVNIDNQEIKDQIIELKNNL